MFFSYELYVDCMPMDGVGELDQAAMRRIAYWARRMGAPQFAKNKMHAVFLVHVQ